MARRSNLGTGLNHSGSREDCWSEGGTQTLVEAWGERYLRLNRGNLRQKDWKEVADAVNADRRGARFPRTDVQCKNRIDTLKKKYKLEKSKPSPSKWQLFHRLDYLIGETSHAVPTSKKKTFVTRSKSRPNPNPGTNPINVVCSAGSSRLNSSGSNESSLGGVEKREHRVEFIDFSEGSAHKELARAILRFGEIYERIESSKQQQMIELEKQRMEFTRELELQRLNMFMEAQLELEKMKRRPIGALGSGKKL